ncbi:Mu transposase C-terminal domain-containing protein [Halalkalibacter sp. AB-rgal2]|uniref:Mu transposase C-terminal domain-containing protein n=1 Tax=Halalkalibacter sp. AB-rgal2 TaxID=3242695 RepID=UPI00359EC461
MNFFVNELLRDSQTDKQFRILWVDEGNIIAYLIDIEDTKALPFKRTISEIKDEVIQELLIKIRKEPFAFPDIDEVSEKYLLLRNQSWEVIEEMIKDEPAIFEKKPRSNHINKAIKVHGVTYPAVRKYLRKYWQRGKTINALLPDYKNSGAKGVTREAGDKKRGRPRKHFSTGINVDDSTKKIFRVALEKYYLTSKQNQLTDAYKMMIKEFYAKDIYFDDGIQKVIIEDKEKIPTLVQFRYWYNKEYNIVESTIARKGQKKFNKDYRAILNTSNSEVNGPGSRYQIDATIGDVYLISKFNPNWVIGRPIIYLVMDVFSRMVVGMYIGLEGPSWLGGMMAIANTVSNKEKFCAEYGITINREEWPSEHLPETLLADRGEFEGYNVERLIDAFGLHVENTAPYRADWKGIVEKHFDLIQKKVKPFLPGYVDKDFQQRGARDYRLDAVLTLDDFTKIIIKQILHYNQKHYLSGYVREEEMVRDDVTPVPLEIWNWGMKNRTGKLKYFPEDTVKIALMKREMATVTHKGINYKGIFYSCDRAIQESWFETARQKGTWKIKVAFDPRCMDNVYIVDSDPTLYEVCTLLPISQRFKSSGLDEIIYLQEQEKHSKVNVNHQQLQKDIDYISEVEAIVKEAVKKRKVEEDTSLSKAEKVGAIKEYRKHEKDETRKAEALKSEKERPSTKAGEVVYLEQSPENGETYARPNIRDFLGRRKENKDE